MTRKEIILDNIQDYISELIKQAERDAANTIGNMIMDEHNKIERLLYSDESWNIYFNSTGHRYDHLRVLRCNLTRKCYALFNAAGIAYRFAKKI